MRRGKKGTEELDELWELHQHKYQGNFTGFSGSMDSAGMPAILQRLVQQHNTRYVEFLEEMKKVKPITFSFRKTSMVM